MIHPPHNGARWPTIDRGSWNVPEFREILRGRSTGPREPPPPAGERGRRVRVAAPPSSRPRGCCSGSSRSASSSEACSPSPDHDWCRAAPPPAAHLVLPGFTASDRSTRPLRRVLRSKGYSVHGWGLGANVGPHPHVVDGLQRRLVELSERYDSPVALVGWSLGGIYARGAGPRAPRSGAARRHPRQPVPLPHRRPRSHVRAVLGRRAARRRSTATTARSTSGHRCPSRRPRSTRAPTGSCAGRRAWSPSARNGRTSR